ncbi:hypothetical protein DPEC_G00364190 [Dallia pectoralis]|nr:hypothetical protein DPEC_G00364190 [Dallia pectoralis]
MMKTMLTIALKQGSKIDPARSVHGTLSTQYKAVGFNKMSTDVFFYARYHHKFNSGEFTEVGCVKPMSDPRYNSLIHEEKLTVGSKYQLIVSHGALPMCTLTLAMTMRQTAMMVMGFLCAELARVVYSPKMTEANLCKHLISLAMAGKFTHGKDDESTNTFEACYGAALKVTGPMFSNSGANLRDLGSMEWFQTDDSSLPDYIQRSLNVIGDVQKEVRKIMQEKDLSYNRLVFMSETANMKFASVFANDEYLIHAPLMIRSNMRIFSNPSNSYSNVKLSKRSCYYSVMVFSNRCIDTTLYGCQGDRSGSCRPRKDKATIDEMVARIKRGVSCVLPKIDVSRIKMMNPEMNDTELALLVSAVEASAIEVTRRDESSSLPSCPKSPEGNGHATHDLWAGVKRSSENPRDSLAKKAKVDDKLTIFDTDADFGFDDSD